MKGGNLNKQGSLKKRGEWNKYEGEQTVDSTTILFIERPSKCHQHLQPTNHFRQEMFSQGLYKEISKEHWHTNPKVYWF